MRFTVIIVTLLSLFFPLFAMAQSPESFEVKLFYDAAQEELRLDKFVDEPVKRVDQKFPQGYTLFLDKESLREEGFSPKNVYSVEFQGFASDVQWTIFLAGDLIQGKQTLYFPYYPHAKSFTIKDPRGSKVTISTTQLAQCNQNNVCEFEKGETQEMCPADCSKQIRSEPVDFSEETKQKLQAQNGVIRNEEGTVLLEGNNTDANNQSEEQTDSSQQDSPNIWFLIGGIVLFVGAVGSWIYLRFVKDEE